MNKKNTSLEEIEKNKDLGKKSEEAILENEAIKSGKRKNKKRRGRLFKKDRQGEESVPK